MARQIEEGLLGSGGNSKFTGNLQPRSLAIFFRFHAAVFSLILAKDYSHKDKNKSTREKLESGSCSYKMDEDIY